MSKKLKSLLRLASSGDWAAVRARWRTYLAQCRVKHAKGQPFAYRSMGLPFVCHPDWPDSVDQLASPPNDIWEVQFLRAWLTPGDSAMDLGANLGFYTFAFAEKVGLSGRVFAVDADGFAADKIQQGATLTGHSQIHVLHAALADHDGEVLFYVRRDHSVTGTQSLCPDAALKDQHVSVSIPSLTMKSLIRKAGIAGTLAVMKVDVEGAEALAFRDLPPDFLSKDGPCWLVEIFPETLARFGVQPQDITRHFPRDEFSSWLIPKQPQPGSKSPPPMRRLREGEGYEDSLYYNLLAIPLGESRVEKRRAVANLLPGATE
jgi:FkbM family methyltransferase